MGLIKEPEGVDFIIKSEPLTKEQEERLSEYIAKRKQEIAEMKKHGRSTKTSSPSPGNSSPESKHNKIAKTRRKSQKTT